LHTLHVLIQQPTLQGSQGGDAADPIAALLVQEQRRGAALIATIDESLASCSAALAATPTQSSPTAALPPLAPAATALMAALVRGETPARWSKEWDSGPEAPLQFMRAVAARVSGAAELAARHAAGRLIANEASPVPLCELFEPLGLLSTLRQVAAQRAGVSVDALVLRNAPSLAELPGSVGDGAGAAICVSGLALEGAVFDGRVLGHVAADAPATAPLPPLALGWVPLDAAPAARQAQGSVALPVYARRDRQCLLLELDVPVRGAALTQELVLAGAAAFVDG
jgi:Dynein heavy chain C-terminal domain